MKEVFSKQENYFERLSYVTNVPSALYSGCGPNAEDVMK
jgi:hypothetical protein